MNFDTELCNEFVTTQPGMIDDWQLHVLSKHTDFLYEERDAMSSELFDVMLNDMEKEGQFDKGKTIETVEQYLTDTYFNNTDFSKANFLLVKELIDQGDVKGELITEIDLDDPNQPHRSVVFS